MKILGASLGSACRFSCFIIALQARLLPRLSAALLCSILLLAQAPFALTLVGACGTDMSASDTYQLTGPLDAGGGTCLTVGASDLAIDCAGFSITNGGADQFGITSTGGWSNNDVGNCTISGFGQGVYFSSVTGGTIHNNVIDATLGSTDISIHIEGGSGILVYDNKLTSNKGVAMQLDSTTTANLTNNSAFSTNAQGILLNGATDNNLTNNTANSTSSNGISLTNTAERNILTANFIQSDATAALSMSTSRSNNISNNTMATGAGSQIGISNDDASNRFWLNNITADTWVSDSSGSFYNTTWQGNIYYSLTSGTGACVDFPCAAWTMLELIDANNDTFADSGSGYPISSSTASTWWTGSATDSRPYTTTLDTAAPVLSGIAPANSAIVNNSNVSFNFTATDILTYVTCNLSIDGTVNQTFNATSGVAYTAYVNATAGLRQGSHSWNATCRDFLNNTRYGATQNFTVDTEPPALELNSPENGFNTTATNISFNFTASDNATGILCNLSINGAVNRTSINLTSSNNTLYTAYANASAGSSMKDGIYNWSVQCIDAAKNAVYSSARNFTIDAAAPAIALNSPADGFESTDSNVTFNFTAYDNLSQNITCNLTIDGSVDRAGFNATNNTAYATWATANFADGAHTWAVSCWDGLNNSAASGTRSFTVDTSVPAPAGTTTPSNNNGGGSTYIPAPAKPGTATADDANAADTAAATDEAAIADEKQAAEEEKAKEEAANAAAQSGATDAISEAESAIAAAISGGGNAGEAAWRVSAAKAAYDRGDYIAAQKLAQEALELGKGALERADGNRLPIREQPKQESAQPRIFQSKEEAAAGLGGALAALSLIAIISACAYFFLLKPAKKK